jgi:hypothetical protein
VSVARPTFVYFMRPIGADGPVKIGCSIHPLGRLSQLMEFGHSHLEIVAAILGDLALERNLHECFLDTHSHREWFNASPRLTACIEALQAGKPIHEAVDLTKRLGDFKRKPRKAQRTSAAWTERVEFNRLRNIKITKKLVEKGARFWPVDIDMLMTHANRHTPFTDAQRARIAQVLADPSQFRTQAQLADDYAAWLAPTPMQRAA